MAIIAIDLGGTKIAAALFDKEGEMHCRQNVLLDGATGTDVGRKIVEVIRTIMGQNPGVEIDAIGICIPGIAYSRTGTVWAPNIPGWDNFPLKQYIVEALGDPALRVEVESDRTCYILGEIWKGAARGCDNAIYLAVGTGIGAGIVIDGHVLHGANDIVGATGWMALQHPYTEEYIPTGCFEYYASGDGIATQARRALRCVRNYTGALAQKPIDEVTSYDVFAAYDAWDPLAVKVLDKAIEMWGAGAANLVSLFNPEKIIFGGGVFGPARMFISRIYDEACKWGQPIAMTQVEFCATEVGNNAALLGAAYTALKAVNSQK
ncbi:MAG: ROK family protein [Bacteroidales bacterium]|nr:ROK family protein [Bacteroidales bacterium]